MQTKNKQRNWFDVRNENTELSKSNVSANAHLVYLVLTLFAGSNSECWPTEDTILLQTGLSDKRTVRKSIAELEKAGFVTISQKKNGRNPNHYKLICREQADCMTNEPSSKNPYDKLLANGNWKEIEE